MSRGVSDEFLRALLPGEGQQAAVRVDAAAGNLALLTTVRIDQLGDTAEARLMSVNDLLNAADDPHLAVAAWEYANREISEPADLAKARTAIIEAALNPIKPVEEKKIARSESSVVDMTTRCELAMKFLEDDALPPELALTWAEKLFTLTMNAGRAQYRDRRTYITEYWPALPKKEVNTYRSQALALVITHQERQSPSYRAEAWIAVNEGIEYANHAKSLKAHELIDRACRFAVDQLPVETDSTSTILTAEKVVELTQEPEIVRDAIAKATASFNAEEYEADKAKAEEARQAFRSAKEAYDAAWTKQRLDPRIQAGISASARRSRGRKRVWGQYQKAITEFNLAGLQQTQDTARAKREETGGALHEHHRLAHRILTLAINNAVSLVLAQGGLEVLTQALGLTIPAEGYNKTNVQQAIRDKFVATVRAVAANPTFTYDINKLQTAYQALKPFMSGEIAGY